MIMSHTMSPMVGNICLPTPFRSLGRALRGNLLLDMDSNTALLRRLHSAPVSSKAYVWMLLTVTGKTHESIGLTFLNLCLPTLASMADADVSLGEKKSALGLRGPSSEAEDAAMAVTTSSGRLGLSLLPICPGPHLQSHLFHTNEC